MVLDALNDKALLWTAFARNCKLRPRVIRRYAQADRGRQQIAAFVPEGCRGSKGGKAGNTRFLSVIFWPAQF